jgi:hypothetical protein
LLHELNASTAAMTTRRKVIFFIRFFVYICCAKVRKVFRKLKLEIRKYIKHCKRTADSPFPANVMTVTDRADARHQVC